MSAKTKNEPLPSPRNIQEAPHSPRFIPQRFIPQMDLPVGHPACPWVALIQTLGTVVPRDEENPKRSLFRAGFMLRFKRLK
jgi:hypothetical protein